MTPEQLLFSALGIVTAWMLVCVKILWARSEQCEHDRLALREEIEELRGAVGLANGELKTRDKCPLSGCPFRPVTAAVLIIAIGLSLGACAQYESHVAAREDSLSGYSKGGGYGGQYTHRVEYR